MIFKSIHLKEGFFERTIKFSEGVNLIHSEKNSCGTGKEMLIYYILMQDYQVFYNIGEGGLSHERMEETGSKSF